MKEFTVYLRVSTLQKFVVTAKSQRDATRIAIAKAKGAQFRANYVEFFSIEKNSKAKVQKLDKPPKALQ